MGSLRGTAHLEGMAVAIWTSLPPTTDSPGHRKYSTSMPIATASLLIHKDELVTRYYQIAGKKIKIITIKTQEKEKD